MELESGKELFFDDFRIFNAPEGAPVKGEKSYHLVPAEKSFTVSYTNAKPLKNASLYILDSAQKYTVFTAGADAAGKVTFSLPALRQGTYQLIAASGGSNTVSVVEAAPQKELDALQKAALQTKIPAGSRILILGDSLSDFLRGRNYADKVALFLKHKNVTVRNAGVKGDMITRVRDRLTGVKTYRPKGYNGIFTPCPDIAMIFLGHNDTVLRNGKIQVPFDEGIKAFRQVLTLLRKKNPKMKIYLLTPVCSLRSACLANMEKRLKQGLGRIEFGRPELLEKYIQMLQKLSKEFNCTLIDVYTPMKKMKDTTSLFNPGDGVHISEAGNRYVALEVLKHL
jgi:lysophospholipase L1-like esterase